MDTQLRADANKFVQNIPLLVSAIGFAALNATSESHTSVIILSIAILCVASFFLDGVFIYWKKNMSKPVAFLSFFLLFEFASTFYSTMISNSKMQDFSSFISISTEAFVAICSLAMFVLAFYSFSLIVELIYSKLKLPETPPPHQQFQCQIKYA